MLYVNHIQKLRELKNSRGISAVVYTQLSDVEGEVNGLMTYDRAVVKVDIDKIAEANGEVYEQKK
jgi:hypothetical protein